MMNNRIANLDTTDMTNQVEFIAVDAASSTTESEYQCDFTKWNGYYKTIPELAATIDKKAIWTVGKGFSCDEKTKKMLEKVRGFGKDTFNDLLYNGVRTYTIGGDFYAEIIMNSRGELKNLKPLNPETIKIIASDKGIIKRYEQFIGGKTTQKFKPDDIFHLSWNRLADSIHGISTIEKIERIILMRNEAMEDMKVVFHRYVKPLLISEIDSDDETAISTYKSKLDAAVKNMENLIIPKGTATIERVSIPQGSNLDPLPWISKLNYYFLMAEGVPEIVLGLGQNSTEASSKMLYLAFQQMIEWNQLFLMSQIKSQLGFDLKLQFPASIEPALLETQSKERKTTNMEMKHNAVK